MLRLLPLLVLLAGCVKQDAEILARVGRKFADKAQAATADLREKIPFRSNNAPSDLVRQRIDSDKSLQSAKIQVVAAGTDVELQGTVNADEKRRAVELAESTRGINKVVDSLQLAVEKAP